MIIANPIYDVVFKYLMADLDIAKGIISRIIDEEIVKLEFTAQEKPKQDIRDFGVVSMYRLDFIAKIKLKSGEYKTVLIEMQKAKLLEDIMRFRHYLAEQYKKQDELEIEDEIKQEPIPIITIYFLGFALSDSLPAAISVKREYKNALTGELITERNNFIECLTHDSYIIQLPQLHSTMKTGLDRMLSVFEQVNFIGSDIHSMEYARETNDELINKMIRELHKVVVDKDKFLRLNAEDDAYDEIIRIIAKNRRELEIKYKQSKKDLLENKKELNENKKELNEKNKEIEKQKKLIDELMKKIPKENS